MNPAYNAAIGCYRGAAKLASLSSAKIRKMLAGQKETAARLAHFRKELAPEGFDVWFHAASLGEFEQARPLIEALLARNGDSKILLSFFSPSGYEVRHNFDPRVAVVYMPFDTPSEAKAFIEAAAPRMAIFVKYEFWGNYLSELKRRGIPTYIISSIFRPGQIFFRPWGGMFRNILRCFDRLFVQDESSRKLLAGIGIDAVTVAGDTRFDRVTDVREKGHDIEEVKTFCEAVPESKILIAGSSWGSDEEVYFPWLASHPEVRAVIAPHEFDKERLASLRHNLGEERTMLLSDFRRIYEESPEKASEIARKLNYLIIDCFGLLSSLYRYADVAYVGGGFGAGLHNINEAAVYGIPVVFGPNNSKFIEARDLRECGGGFEVTDKLSADRTLTRLFSDESTRKTAGASAGNYISTHIGATKKILTELFPDFYTSKTL